MKMLKKFAVVLLLSGSCGLQAMHGLGEPEINSSDHVQANPHMYHYDDDGINMSSIRYELKDEYKPAMSNMKCDTKTFLIVNA